MTWLRGIFIDEYPNHHKASLTCLAIECTATSSGVFHIAFIGERVPSSQVNKLYSSFHPVHQATCSLKNNLLCNAICDSSTVNYKSCVILNILSYFAALKMRSIATKPVLLTIHFSKGSSGNWWYPIRKMRPLLGTIIPRFSSFLVLPSPQIDYLFGNQSHNTPVCFPRIIFPTAGGLNAISYS